MKNILFLVISFMLLQPVFSQDLIIMKSGEEVKSKVIEITSSEVKYKKFENQTGPIFSLLKSEIFIIKYENGTKDIFNDEKTNINTITNNNEDLFIKGKIDAQRNYDGYKGAGTGTLLTSLIISPLVGLIPAIACSSTPPKDENLNYPNSELMKNSNYYNGYTQKAKKIKQGKVWTNWGIAFGVNLVAVLILTANQK